MSPEVWRLVRGIFEKAIALDAPTRASYLRQACSDENIRREVASLLAAHESDENFMGLYSTLAGKVLSHYQILERLGAGGMSIVYRARDRHLGRLVAVKVLDPLKMGDPQSQKQLIDEARHASALNHPNIVTIHDAGRSKGMCYVVMEHLDGRTLEQAVPQRGWSMNQALGYAQQIGSALVAAHKHGIVHGDLKPANIILTSAGQVKLLDFGLARVLMSENPGLSQPSVKRFGTKAYMAPELLMQYRVYPDHRSEIFTFGLILFQMLTGRHAFGSGNRELIAQNIRYDQPGSLPPKVDTAVAAIIHRCLEKDPADRFQSMADLILALGSTRTNSQNPPSVASPNEPQTDLRSVARTIRRIRYSNLAQSRAALANLETLIQTEMSQSGRSAIARGLGEVLLTLPDTNGLSWPVRELRNEALRILRQAAGNRLADFLKPHDLDGLDLYGMDFGDAELLGFTFKGSFLVEARLGGNLAKDI